MTNIHPSVLAATCEELLRAGWGDCPRHMIPADWRERAAPPAIEVLYVKPIAVSVPRKKRTPKQPRERLTTPEFREKMAAKMRKWRAKTGQFPGRKETPELRREIALNANKAAVAAKRAMMQARAQQRTA